MTNERIPYLTVGERADLHGLSFDDELALERDHPWVKGWAARFNAATENLRAWLAAGRPRPDRARLTIDGDRCVVQSTRAVVERLPDPVAWFLVNTALVRCNAGRTRGRCSDGPRPPCEGYVLIELHDGDPDVAAHEFAHAYQHRPMPVELRDVAAEEIAAAIVEAGLIERAVAYRDLKELAADTLASAWLGRRVHTRGAHLPDYWRAEFQLAATLNHNNRSAAMETQAQNQPDEHTRDATTTKPSAVDESASPPLGFLLGRSPLGVPGHEMMAPEPSGFCCDIDSSLCDNEGHEIAG